MIELAAATFAITYMIRFTDGPGDIFLRFRKLVGFTYIDRGDEIVEVVDDKFLPKLVECFWCFGTWIALCVVLLNTFVPFIVQWFAIIGIAGAVYMWLDNG